MRWSNRDTTYIRHTKLQANIKIKTNWIFFPLFFFFSCVCSHGWLCSEWLLLLLILLFCIVIVILYTSILLKPELIRYTISYILPLHVVTAPSSLSPSPSPSSSSSSSSFPSSFFLCIFFVLCLFFPHYFAVFNRFNENPVHVCACMCAFLYVCFNGISVCVRVRVCLDIDKKYTQNMNDERTFCCFTVNAAAYCCFYYTHIFFFFLNFVCTFENDVVTV